MYWITWLILDIGPLDIGHWALDTKDTLDTFRKTGEAAGGKDGSLTWPISDSGHSILDIGILEVESWTSDIGHTEL